MKIAEKINNRGEIVTQIKKQNSKRPKQESGRAAAKKMPAKKTPVKKESSKKTAPAKKDDFVRQNIIALFLLIFGMVFLISITTNALGPIGVLIKSMLLGQLAKISIFIALGMIFVGAARLVYNTKFDLKTISPIMLLLIFLGSLFLYGALNTEIVQAESVNFALIRTIYLESIVGDSIGIIPYIVTFYMVRIMHKLGMMITAATLFLFVGVYYFRITFAKVGDISAVMAKESGKLAKNIKTKTIDFVTVEVEEEGQKPSRKERKAKKQAQIEARNAKIPEKLDATMIDQNFNFLDRYKADIEEFKEDFIEETPPMIEETAQESLQPIENTVKENPAPAIKFNLESHDSREHGEVDDGMTKKFHGLADILEVQALEQTPGPERVSEVQQASAQKIDNEMVDLRDIHQKSEKEKEDLLNEKISTKNSSEKPEVGKQAKYTLPGFSLLKEYAVKENDSQHQLNSAKKLESTLDIFGIEAKVANIAVGPTITRYELQPKMGVKVSKILNLSDDLALSLAAIAPIRIEAPIPGTSFIGIEVPNAKTDIVGFRSVLESWEFKDPKKEIPIALGRDVSGKPVIEDIARMPHLLVAGSTGSGKSVCINTLICSILYKFKPEDIKMIMIDPKMVELSVYNNIPHLLIPVVTDMKKAPYALSWAVGEMNKRYKLFTENRVRDLKSYNEVPGVEKLPRIVIIVDELADLMMVSPNEVEDSIIRLAQKARACGMHLVIATQRPSVDVITGLIKANIPSRISFAVSSQVDSRTILDQGGAEKLIGKGDMLFSHPSIPKPQRIQGSFITDNEVNAVVEHILGQSVEIKTLDIIEEAIQNHIEEQKEEETDPLIDEIVEFAIKNKQLSTSLIQRRFKVGYNRASRLIDALEEMGVVSESDGAKPRRVLIDSIEALRKKEED